MMFFFEQYLRKKGVTKSFPLPCQKGFITYQYEDLFECVEIVSFFWDHVKGRPNYFAFRKINNLVDSDGVMYTNHSCNYVTWDKFFSTWHRIKSEIKSKQNVKIAQNITEAKNQIWKSFVISKDAVLSKYVNLLPSDFFKSLDSRLSEEEKLQSQISILNYLRQNLSFIHASWVTFFETNMDDSFCLWFPTFFAQDDE